MTARPSPTGSIAPIFSTNRAAATSCNSPSSLTFERGSERIIGMRLSPKGLYRWYASCCKTPLGNTVSAAVPFIGLARQAIPDISDTNEQDTIFGRAFPVLGKSAIGPVPAGSLRPSLRMLARVTRLLLRWKLGGKAWPHPLLRASVGQPPSRSGDALPASNAKPCALYAARIQPARSEPRIVSFLARRASLRHDQAVIEAAGGSAAVFGNSSGVLLARRRCRVGARNDEARSLRASPLSWIARAPNRSSGSPSSSMTPSRPAVAARSVHGHVGSRYRPETCATGIGIAGCGETPQTVLVNAPSLWMLCQPSVHEPPEYLWGSP